MEVTYSIENILKRKKDIVKKIKAIIITPTNYCYNLVGGITMSHNEHFTCFIKNFNYIQNFSDKFEKIMVFF